MNSSPNDVEKSVKTIEMYYKMKQNAPELFTNRDVKGREIKESLDHQDFVPLPITPENCDLIFHRLSSFEPSHYIFDEAVKTFITTCEAYSYQNGPRSGTIFVFDLRGATFSHMFRPSLSTIRKGMKFLQEGCPLDIKAIHVLNTVPFFDIIIGKFDTIFVFNLISHILNNLGLIKPLSRSDFFKKIHFHSSNMDYEVFYRDCVPKSHLPEDYGGDLESVEVLHRRYRENLMKLRNYFLMEEQQWKFKFDEYVDEFGEEAFKKAGYF